ncbi:hypothetical protein HanPI659440_Chr01g0003551 [Helianthus annuus]|uniref:Secreted protein n=1 Tax=Helianthus annuus TaxID=4232 RepID=A0A251VLG8_HELAN|nr:hypothetical protein HanXRQr2_Chr01g0003811 [Helianthus annuus]KAJ0808455.1 hypothetical protein HanPI659440_Chr01g0003551 [Helianthus annuus]
MISKRLLLVFAVVLLISSEITANELPSNVNESELEDAKYDREYYKGGLGVGGFTNRRLKQSAPVYNNPDPPTYTPCCFKKAEATAYKQAYQTHSTHNK